MKVNSKKYSFLEEMAKSFKVIDYRLAKASDLVVEERVVLRCKSGCPGYGKSFVCPPNAPTPKEFKSMLKDYKDVFVVKLPAKATASEDIRTSLIKNLYAPDISPELAEKTKDFWKTWNEDKNRNLLYMLELEKSAYLKGYPLAIALSPGGCALCDPCPIEGGACIHPSMARYPEHALGINVAKTLNNIGMSINFPIKDKPEAVGFLLID